MKRPSEKEMKEAVRVLLRGLGEDPDREGLIDTPRRVVHALKEMTEGYKIDPGKILKTLFAADGFDQMVVLADIEFHSLCEHHMLPFFGKAAVGYIPGKSGKILGISKLARLIDVYARRLQNQERITQLVADALMKYSVPLGVAVVLKAEHQCMACRGVKKPGARMVTSAMEGLYRYNDAARMEFFEHLKKEYE